MCTNNIYIPWVEKYRPNNLNDIVLDPLNKKIINNILEKQYFPNILFYGPPGTGKTTTIINLINNFHNYDVNKSKELMIHLNASDERGIDIIRSQINNFVNSKTLFTKGIKFVVLDEVDYMTKNAQQALKYLLQGYNNKNVRFCLICNYISRIDESLQNEFMRIRFNQLPDKDIMSFLEKININENLNLSSEILQSIQKMFHSDIRSMINYMQSNQDVKYNVVLNNKIWNNFTKIIQTTNKKKICKELKDISHKYNIEIKNIIKNYLNHIIRKYPQNLNNNILNKIEFIMHLNECNIEYYINYSVNFLLLFFEDK